MNKKRTDKCNTRRYTAWWQARVRDKNRNLVGYINAGCIDIIATDVKTAVSVAKTEARKVLGNSHKEEGEKLTPRITAIIDQEGQIHQIKRIMQGAVLDRFL